MSIDNQNIKLKPILIGKGFPASGEHSNYYPKDRLIKFLNINPKDIKKVWEYCRNYILLPRDIRGNPDGWLKGFQKEHKEISDISKRAANNLLTEKDLRKINRVLRNIHREFDYISGEEISNLNLDLEGDELSKDARKQKYSSLSNHHYGSIVSLWDDLAKQIVSNQSVRQCIYCGKFFEVVSHSHGQKFCTGTNCQNTYNQRKRRDRKNLKKSTP